MTTKRRQDPYRSFNFALELDGRAIAGFSDVSGLNGDVTVLEHRTGTEPATATRKLPGLHKFTNITLKRGVANGSTLYAWQTSGAAGRRPATVVLRDEAGQPVCRWQIARASIRKIVGPTLNATGTDVAVETLELAHEGLRVED